MKSARPRWQVEQAYLDNLFDMAQGAAGQPTTIAQAELAQPIDCQLILVTGLMFAVPVSAFSQVLTGCADIESAASTGSLLAGQVWHDGNPVDVIDLAAVIVAGRQSALPRTARNSDDGVILLLHDGVTGLLCDRLAQRITVLPERLCWRQAHSRRTWLAATAREDGFALLDIDGIIRLLRQAPATAGYAPPDGEET